MPLFCKKTPYTGVIQRIEKAMSVMEPSSEEAYDD